MKLFFSFIFVFFFSSLSAQDSARVQKRNIIKPHLLTPVWNALFYQAACFDLEFERELNQRNSFSPGLIYYQDRKTTGIFINIDYRHYLKNKKDKALRGFYYGGQVFYRNHQHDYRDFLNCRNYIGLTGLFGYQTFIKDRISLDWGLGAGAGFKVYDNYKGPYNAYSFFRPEYRLYFSIGYSFFSR
ncbi:MAG: DUF3575 domain-containing protein [Cytophagaceae bacterium]